VGEISLLVIVSSKHRQAATAACTEHRDWLKAELPIWGMEIFGCGSYRWKENNSGSASIGMEFAFLERLKRSPAPMQSRI
jgi:molybdopterin synthase catalytic subunit